MPFHVSVHPIGEYHHHYCLFYLCKPKTRQKGTIHYDKSELTGAEWFSLEDLNHPRIEQAVRFASKKSISFSE